MSQYTEEERKPVSPLVVTRNGEVCPDQKAALEEFKSRCRAGRPVGGGELPPLEITDDDWERAKDAVPLACRERQLLEALTDNAALRKKLAQAEQERNEWRRKYFEMERAHSCCIDRNGELLRVIRDREADRSREQDLKNQFRQRVEAAEQEKAKLVEALTRISKPPSLSEEGYCGCKHDTEDCCATVNVWCPVCIAATALAFSQPPQGEDTKEGE